MADLWTLRRIAREYDIDPKTAHYWSKQPWFPRPEPGSLYDPAKVRQAVLRRRRQRSSRSARIVRAYRSHGTVNAAANAGRVHRNTARKILQQLGEL